MMIPQESQFGKKKSVCAIGVPNYILANANWGLIGAIDVARQNTLCGTVTS
jgi:hypothetical protein